MIGRAWASPLTSNGSLRLEAFHTWICRSFPAVRMRDESGEKLTQKNREAAGNRAWRGSVGLGTVASHTLSAPYL